MNFGGPTLRVVLPKITVVYYTGFYEETNCHHLETECNFTGAKSIQGKTERVLRKLRPSKTKT